MALFRVSAEMMKQKSGWRDNGILSGLWVSVGDDETAFGVER